MPRRVDGFPGGGGRGGGGYPAAAARAVPRLIAVVVFPTPPFWLAIAKTRGRRRTSGEGSAEAKLAGSDMILSSSWCRPLPYPPPLAGKGRAGVRLDRAWTIKIRPALLVLLGMVSASIIQCLVAMVNSISKSCPFGKKAFAPFFRN